MPELPELEVVRRVLASTVVNHEITGVQIAPKGGPIVIRDLTNKGFGQGVMSRRVTSIARRGKFIVFELRRADDLVYLAINPKLTGRLQLAKPGEKALPKTHIILSISDNLELRYADMKMMGQVYLTENMTAVPDWLGMGPEPFEISSQEFRERIRQFRGEIKGILTRGEFVAGIGNAYADEILWAAGIHPYRKKTTLKPDEIDRLYVAIQETLSDAICRVEVEMGRSIHLKPRDFLKVHMKTGEPCPRCGTIISLVGANQRTTNFCRKCQPGGLIKGM